MTFRRRVPSIVLAAALAASAWPGGTAHAGDDRIQSLRGALSLISGGLTDALGPALRLSDDDGKILICIDLPRWTPSGLAVSAIATERPTGVWRIDGITVPARALLPPQPAPRPGAPPTRFGYSVARQAGEARIDPSLPSPSTYRIALDGLVFGAPPTAGRTTIGELGLSGTLTGESGGLIDRRSHLTVRNLRFSGRDQFGAPIVLSVRALDADYDVLGFDRARAARLRRTMAAIPAVRRGDSSVAEADDPPLAATGGPPVTATGGPPPSRRGGQQAAAVQPRLRRQLLAMIDAGVGLMSGARLDETFHGVDVAMGEGDADIGTVHLVAAGERRYGRLAAHVDIEVDGLALPGAPSQFRPFLPHRLAIRLAVSGMQADALRALLQQAVEGGSQDFLRAQAMALLAEPGAKAGIQALSADFGPLHLRGSALVRPLPDGTAALDLHLSATGLKKLLHLLDTDPALHRAIPLLLLANGLGRREDRRTVWDIVLDHGAATINGIALGPLDHASPPAHGQGDR